MTERNKRSGEGHGIGERIEAMGWDDYNRGELTAGNVNLQASSILFSFAKTV